MSDLDHLQIDLADPADIRAKLPRIQAILEFKRQAANAAVRDLENFHLLAERLEIIAGVRDEPPKSDSARKRKSAPAQDAVVAAINRSKQPVNPVAVYEMLKADGFPVKNPNAVNSALYAAANNGRIKKHGHGLYAPLEFESAPGDELIPSDNGSDPDPVEAGDA
jgi:hypothetical protein